MNFKVMPNKIMYLKKFQVWSFDLNYKFGPLTYL